MVVFIGPIKNTLRFYKQKNAMFNFKIPGKLADYPAVSPCPGQRAEISANFR
jgi:hypothetical protein